MNHLDKYNEEKDLFKNQSVTQHESFKSHIIAFLLPALFFVPIMILIITITTSTNESIVSYIILSLPIAIYAFAVVKTYYSQIEFIKDINIKKYSFVNALISALVILAVCLTTLLLKGI